ncbi:hypothetical protein CBS101457_001497 [Exobasidium rhododendri]|nr:hypothetical protein CBS101457_001497 [Exobasidium rhododendri]
MSAEKKQEADYTKEVDALVITAERLASSGKLQEALEQVNGLEKKARNAADLPSTTRLLLLALHLLRTTPSPTSPNWEQLNETIVSLSRKHGQLKQAITKMVGAAMCYLHPPGVGESGKEEIEEEVEMREVEVETSTKDEAVAEGVTKADKEKHGESAGAAKDEKKAKMKEAVEEASEDKGEGKENEGVRILMDKAKEVGNTGVTEQMRLKLVETIRQVTEGKIFVEVARARSTLILSQMLEAKGNLAEAADKLGELAVETFGSMDRREKHEIIMEQMRLYKLRGDWARMGIVGKKINTKFFIDVKQHDLKLRFYNLMIEFSLHARKTLDVCKHYYEIYDTPMIKNDTPKASEALRNLIVYLVLSPFDNEQSDLMARVGKLEDLDKVPEHQNLLKCFTTPELMRWPGIETLYTPILRVTPTFDQSEEGNYRWEELHKRVVEHNIRVISKYYTRITLERLSQLLDLSQDVTETSLSGLVTNHTVHAKIDRPAGLVNFEKKKDNAEKLNLWTNDMTQLLNLVEATSHLVAREYAVSRAGLVVTT